MWTLRNSKTAMSATGKRNLYVGGLDRQVTEEVLYAAFVPFGPLKSVQIPSVFDSSANKGFGYIEFEDEEDARAAIDNMDESELFGKTLRVTIAKPERPKLGSNKPVWAEANPSNDAAMEEAGDESRSNASA